MKKKIFIITFVLILALALSGCGLFSSDDGGSGDAGASGTADGIKLSDELTYAGPSDLDYDKYYLASIAVDPNNEYSANAEYVEYGLTENYHVTYAKEDKPVQQDDVYVCDTEDNAKKLMGYFDELQKEMGVDLAFAIDENDPKLIVYSKTAEEIDAEIQQYASYDIGISADADAATYAKFDADLFEGVMINQ